MAFGRRLREAYRRGVEHSSFLARPKHVARSLEAEYLGITGGLRYHPSDQWWQEFADLKSFIRRAFQVLVYNGIEGDYAEFGCWGARTFTLAWGAARLVGHPAHLWAFDSFQGLPATTDTRDDHPGWTPGQMTMSETVFTETCLANGVPRQAFTIVPGFYADSLSPDVIGPRPERICFAYIDCDLYSSTTEVLRFLAPRLRHGMVLAFDDYYCYSPSRPSGERLAIGELFAENPDWQLLPFVQWGWYGMSFIVERRAVGPTGVRGW
jgi:O-methyltransferase